MLDSQKKSFDSKAVVEIKVVESLKPESWEKNSVETVCNQASVHTVL